MKLFVITSREFVHIVIAQDGLEAIKLLRSRGQHEIGIEIIDDVANAIVISTEEETAKLIKQFAIA